MQLHEICEHPWFRNNAPIRPVITLESLQAQAQLPQEGADGANAQKSASGANAAEITRMSKNITIEGNIDNVEY